MLIRIGGSNLCGSFYGSKIWHSTDKYRRVVYRCNRKYDSCGSNVHLTEDELKDVVRALNEYLDNKDEVIANLESLMVSLYSVDALERELSSVTSQIAVSKEMYITALQSRPITDSTQLSGKVLREADKFVDGFSPFLFISLVDKVVVYSKEDVRVSFRDGREV